MSSVWCLVSGVWCLVSAVRCPLSPPGIVGSIILCMSTPRLEAISVRKQFPGVLALDGVSLRFLAGEVLAVVGENGAGKSTLMKILGGLYSADDGEIRLDGQPVRFANVNDAMVAGIVLFIKNSISPKTCRRRPTSFWVASDC